MILLSPLRVLLLLIAATVFSLSAAHSGEKHASSSLVRGRVERVEEGIKRESAVATVKIVHIYSGMANLLGKSFTDKYLQIDLRGDAAHSPFEVGEEGLWTVKQVENDIQLSSRADLPFRHRFRKSNGLRYAPMIRLAEGIEKLESVAVERRVAVFRELAKDITPEVAGWAMATLAASDTADARKYLDALAAKPDPTLPIAAQVALDAALSKRDDGDWPQSKQRLAMLRAWVAAKRDEHDGMAILQRVIKAHGNQGLRDSEALELFVAAAGNREWPWYARRFAIMFGVGGVARGGVDNEAAVAAYEWLFDRIRKDADIEVRRAAAYTMRNSVILFPPQIKIIEEYLPKEPDKEVKAALAEAVKNAKEKK